MERVEQEHFCDRYDDVYIILRATAISEINFRPPKYECIRFRRIEWKYRTQCTDAGVGKIDLKTINRFSFADDKI